MIKQMQLAAVAALALASPAAALAEPTVQPVASAEMTEDALVAMAQGLIRSSLRDPDSAQFQNARVVRSVISEKAASWSYLPLGQEIVAVCVDVNARNGFGGMSGWRPFVYFHRGRDHARIATQDRAHDRLFFAAVCAPDLLS